MEAKMRVPLLLLLSTWCLTGCVDSDELDRSPERPSTLSSDDSGPSLPLLINLAVSHISADTCFAQADTSMCQWADYGMGPSFVNMEVSTNEAILMIDDFPDGSLPQLLRYRNRIVNLYRASGDTIQPQPVSMHLPKALGDALVSFAGPSFISSSLLGAVNTAAAAAYGNVPLLFLGHGGIVFSHLVELAPEQPLVLLQLSGLLGVQPSLCQHIDTSTLTAASQHFTAIANALRQLMQTNNVKFVNASFGDSVQTLAADWSRTCGTAVPSSQVVRQLLHLYDPVYDVLFNTSGVVTAQAATDLGAAQDFPFDQPISRYANRVRVGFISSLNSGLDPQGRGTVQKTEQSPRNNTDADVFLNWDCLSFGACADPHYRLAGSFGLGATNLLLMATSYIDPLGLGRLINLRYANHAGQQMSNTLIQTLRHELTPALCGGQPCVYQDPIAHRQLEVYRQGYLP
jgi:hypothetical protein